MIFVREQFCLDCREKFTLVAAQFVGGSDRKADRKAVLVYVAKAGD
jgi:hypothetical protein